MLTENENVAQGPPATLDAQRVQQQWTWQLVNVFPQVSHQAPLVTWGICPHSPRPPTRPCRRALPTRHPHEGLSPDLCVLGRDSFTCPAPSNSSNQVLSYRHASTSSRWACAPKQTPFRKPHAPRPSAWPRQPCTASYVRTIFKRESPGRPVLPAQGRTRMPLHRSPSSGLKPSS